MEDVIWVWQEVWRYWWYLATGSCEWYGSTQECVEEKVAAFFMGEPTHLVVMIGLAVTLTIWLGRRHAK